MKTEVYGTCMVFDIEPIAYVLSFAVHGQRLLLPNVVDE
jgi:hypothetical protein